MAKVFITRLLPEPTMQRFRSCKLIGDLKVSPHDRVLTKEELAEGIQWCDVAVTQLTDAVDDSVLALNPRLRLVANYAVGYNNIDAASARRRGVLVSNTPGVLTDATADLAFSLLLACARNVVSGERYLRDGRWRSWAPTLLLGADVHHKVLGVVGMGRIGAAVARRALGFAMRVVYCDARDAAAVAEAAALGGGPADGGALRAAVAASTRMPLDDLLRCSDFVSLHVPLTPETRGMLGAERLALMKPTAFLINTARGAVVDEAALCRALRSGAIAGVGLDVYENEPAISEELLQCTREFGSCVLVPHIGSATLETRCAMGDLVFENVVACLENKPLPTRIP
ncbi:D-glycerate dehydrogenase [Pelomyxa schiedti]|nr:D-glycerate dehydrogenase [Pelomyxa schiedti]